MKTASNRLLGATGALVGVGIVVAVSGGQAGDAIEQILFAGATLGRAVGEFTLLGFVLGAVAFGVRQLAIASRESRLAKTRPVALSAAGAVMVHSVPRLADATASEFDDALQPSFAPVTSLIEAQVARERAARRREERRALSTRA
jgi:hypothetical protein